LEYVLAYGGGSRTSRNDGFKFYKGREEGGRKTDPYRLPLAIKAIPVISLKDKRGSEERGKGGTVFFDSRKKEGKIAPSSR